MPFEIFKINRLSNKKTSTVVYIEDLEFVGRKQMFRLAYQLYHFIVLTTATVN